MIEKLDEEVQTSDNPAVVKSFCGLINKIDNLCNETVSFDASSMTINWYCEKKKSPDPTKAARKALQNQLPPMSTEFYK